MEVMECSTLPIAIWLKPLVWLVLSHQFSLGLWPLVLWETPVLMFSATGVKCVGLEKMVMQIVSVLPIVRICTLLFVVQTDQLTHQLAILPDMPV